MLIEKQGAGGRQQIAFQGTLFTLVHLKMESLVYMYTQAHTPMCVCIHVYFNTGLPLQLLFEESVSNLRIIFLFIRLLFLK